MGVGDQRHSPAALPPGKDSLSIVQEAGWSPRLIRKGAENLAFTEIRSPDRPARSESLHRMRYSGPCLTVYKRCFFCCCCEDVTRGYTEKPLHELQYSVVNVARNTTLFKKRPNFLNSAPTSTDSAMRLLRAPSVRF
jgi:hypothetical protein